ncbi:unnamed protein product [Rangifer tarandus platyrhynchus]|uniref:Uncharacterized protein n=2 Tax=Rangifer tarandus platyrhynchus TaxID=3082113 RepID=A0AC59ZGE7_RANTA|nr:unnamed protein product [Rangifer tarandus platyrhynchus]
MTWIIWLRKLLMMMWLPVVCLPGFQEPRTTGFKIIFCGVTSQQRRLICLPSGFPEDHNHAAVEIVLQVCIIEDQKNQPGSFILSRWPRMRRNEESNGKSS